MPLEVNLAVGPDLGRRQGLSAGADEGDHWFEPDRRPPRRGPTCATRSPRARCRRSTTSSRALGLEPGQRVLDVGCGPGRHAHELARRGIACHGIDISARFVELAREDAPPGATFERLDARALRVRRPSSTPRSPVPGRLRLVARRPATTRRARRHGPGAAPGRPARADRVQRLLRGALPHGRRRSTPTAASPTSAPRSGTRPAPSPRSTCGPAATRPVSCACWLGGARPRRRRGSAPSNPAPTATTRRPPSRPSSWSSPTAPPDRPRPSRSQPARRKPAIDPAQPRQRGLARLGLAPATRSRARRGRHASSEPPGVGPTGLWHSSHRPCDDPAPDGTAERDGRAGQPAGGPVPAVLARLGLARG